MINLSPQQGYLNAGFISQEFQCTRHATSCNNIYMGKSIRGIDSEPALSAYGINGAIDLARKEKEKGSERFLAPAGIPIAVSALIRTWETAVLLYGYNNKGVETSKLEIRICPWLKETGWDGNDPKPLAHGIPKFIKFLDKLKPIYDNGDNYNIREIHIHIPPTTTHKKLKNNASLSTMGREWQTIVIQLNGNTYRCINFCDIIDTIHDDSFWGSVYGYQKDEGNIMKFMKWYTTVFSKEYTPVHIVAHSHIMQAFAKDVLKQKLEKEQTEQNCWSISMTYLYRNNGKYRNGEKDTALYKNIQNGFPKPTGRLLENAQSDEKSKQMDENPISLCGKYGSVTEFSCASGGRRTRRKRSYRKKTRRHRR